MAHQSFAASHFGKHSLPIGATVLTAGAIAAIGPRTVELALVGAAQRVADSAASIGAAANIRPMGALAIVVVLFFAGLVSGLSGFAFSAVAACVLWLLPPMQAVPLIMLLSASNQLFSIGSLRKEMMLLPKEGRDGAIPYILGGLVGVPLGLALLRNLPCAGFVGALGVFLISYSVLMLCKPDTLRLSLSGWKPAVAAGAMGGLVGGFSAFPGSIPVVYMGLRGVGKAETRGVTQPYILTLQLVSLTILLATDHSIFNARMGLLWSMAMPAALLGTFTGVRLYKRLSDVNFRRAVLVLLAISGASLLAKVMF